MLISQMFKRKPCVFSIECFPPKETVRFERMKDALRTMKTLNPDFISVHTAPAVLRAVCPPWRWPVS